MAQEKDVQGIKTRLKGNQQSSIKDQVKQALLKNKSKGVIPPQSAQDGQSGLTMAQQIAHAKGQASSPMDASGSTSNSGNQGASIASISPVVTKIEKTVDAINDVHSTMENLNKNMNLFVNLFKNRGGSLASGGDERESISSEGGDINQTNPTTGEQNFGNASAGGQNAVTTLLLTNLLKKKDEDTEEKLSTFEKGTQEYLNLLIKKLQKYQSEYDLLQYLFEPKMLGKNVFPSDDAQGNSAWLAAYMSMMNRK